MGEIYIDKINVFDSVGKKWNGCEGVYAAGDDGGDGDGDGSGKGFNTCGGNRTAADMMEFML